MNVRMNLLSGVVLGSFLVACAGAQTATTETKVKQTTPTQSTSTATATDAKKHPAGVKYEDHTAPPATPNTSAVPATSVPVDGAKIKSHSNQTNNREAATAAPSKGATKTTVAPKQ